jgi:endonuclease YncB( thermonuclease family)
VGSLEVKPLQKSKDVVQGQAGKIGFGEVIDDRSQVVALVHPSRLARHPSPGDEIFRAYDEGKENRERFRIGLAASSRSTIRPFQSSASMCKPYARLNSKVSRLQVRSRSIPMMVSMRFLLTVAFLFLAFTPGHAGDADTLTIGGTAYRLDGIDAPEIDQNCIDASGVYPCGQLALEALEGLVGSRRVHCEDLGQDPKYPKRRSGRCMVDGTDLHRWLVKNGWALNFEPYAAVASRMMRAMRARAGPACGRRALWRRETSAAGTSTRHRWSAQPAPPMPAAGSFPTTRRCRQAARSRENTLFVRR